MPGRPTDTCWQAPRGVHQPRKHEPFAASQFWSRESQGEEDPNWREETISAALTKHDGLVCSFFMLKMVTLEPDFWTASRIRVRLICDRSLVHYDLRQAKAGREDRKHIDFLGDGGVLLWSHSNRILRNRDKRSPRRRRYLPLPPLRRLSTLNKNKFTGRQED